MTSKKIIVKKIVSSRYQAGVARPSNWDERTEGVDVVEADDGTTVSLKSSGQQSVPQPGWVILLGNEPSGPATWTLFGMPKGSAVQV